MMIEIREVKERNAAVRIEDSCIKYVNNRLARRLKQIGFDAPCRYFYNSIGDIMSGVEADHNQSKYEFSCPSLYEVVEWLKTQGVMITTSPFFEFYEIDGKKNRRPTDYYQRAIFIKDNGIYCCLKRYSNAFASEQDAIAVSINEAINYYKSRLK